MRNWVECIESGNSMKITPDLEKAKSLLEIAKERIYYASKKLDKRNINFVFEDYYSSIVEIIHSVALVKGFKIINHICLGRFLTDILNREDLFIIFDDLRYKRNSLVYYGKKMDFETGKDAIGKCDRLIKALKSVRTDT